MLGISDISSDVASQWDTKQSLSYHSEKLIEAVCSCITLLEMMMAKVACSSSVKEYVSYHQEECQL
jgi:hypothetical protein